MIRSLLVFIATVILFSCNKNTGIKDFVKDADSVAINFFKGDGSMDSVIKVVIIKDKKQVQHLAGYIEASRTGDFKCGYDGSLHFFKRDMVLKDVDFRMNDVQCMYFSFVMNDKLYNTVLSAEAKALLENVRK